MQGKTQNCSLFEQARKLVPLEKNKTYGEESISL